MAFVKVASTAEVLPNSARQVSINGKKIAIFNAGGKLFALEDSCPHSRAPLSQGVITETEVTCPLHTARFELATGKHLCPPADNDVVTYPVQIVGDEIQVDAS